MKHYAHVEMLAATLGSVPLNCHSGSNEQSRPYLWTNEARLVQSAGLIIRDAKGRQKDYIAAMRVLTDNAIPSFLESEEFLSKEHAEEFDTLQKSSKHK